MVKLDYIIEDGITPTLAGGGADLDRELMENLQAQAAEAGMRVENEYATEHHGRWKANADWWSQWKKEHIHQLLQPLDVQYTHS